MERTLITSTALRSAGYDEKAQAIEIEFLHGSVYRYLGVSRDVFDGLIAAESHGAYYDEHIKKAGYSFERVL